MRLFSEAGKERARTTLFLREAMGSKIDPSSRLAAERDGIVA